MTDVVAKHHINLLRPELIPVEPLWSLKRVCIVWAVVTLAMLLWVAFSQYQLKHAQQTFSQLSEDQVYLSQSLVDLEKALAEHKPDNNIKNKIDLLALLLNNKTQLHAELTDSTKTQVAGFARTMTELAENHHKGVSLSSVHINPNFMSFVGLTKTPQSVPAWLAGFENSTFLSGKSFVNFLMKENENKHIEFSVSSKANIEEANNE